jgi:hypothetical protein
MPTWTRLTLGILVGVRSKKSGKTLENTPSIDHLGKLHGKLPKRSEWTKYSKENLEQLLDDLKKSVKERDFVNKTHPKGVDYGHGKRLADEHQLIKDIEKFLSGS